MPGLSHFTGLCYSQHYFAETGMSKIVLDADLRAKLGGAKEGVEFTDENGNVVGHFIPHEAYLRMADTLLPPLTRDEIANARREMLEQGGVGTAELLNRLAEIQRRWETRR
jgi:hypothetical protein